MTEPICFPAQVVKVQTLADGGIRVTLDLPESHILEAAQLMEVKRAQAYGQVEFTPAGQVRAGDKTRGLETRAKRQSAWGSEEKPDAHSDSGDGREQDA